MFGRLGTSDPNPGYLKEHWYSRERDNGFLFFLFVTFFNSSLLSSQKIVPMGTKQ